MRITFWHIRLIYCGDSTNSPQSFLIEYGPTGFLPGTGTSAATTNLTIGYLL
ncbi:MAG: hypothetical protein HC803_00730 [Saprospiraceae bacterium]|nr:hypothetical protein [Saprospiraceae bacterium]